MNNINFNNRKRVTFLIGCLFLFFFISIVIPSLFINYLTFSGVGHFFSRNMYYGIISIIILIYFIVVGEYYFSIQIDSYVIKVTSYKSILDFFKKKDFIDIPHSMLRSYSFFNRPLSFNKTLMFKIETEKGKKITKRFNLTLISKKEINAISQRLDNIIAKK